VGRNICMIASPPPTPSESGLVVRGERGWGSGFRSPRGRLGELLQDPLDLLPRRRARRRGVDGRGFCTEEAGLPPRGYLWYLYPHPRMLHFAADPTTKGGGVVWCSFLGEPASHTAGPVSIERDCTTPPDPPLPQQPSCLPSGQSCSLLPRAGPGSPGRAKTPRNFRSASSSDRPVKSAGATPRRHGSISNHVPPRPHFRKHGQTANPNRKKKYLPRQKKSTIATETKRRPSGRPQHSFDYRADPERIRRGRGSGGGGWPGDGLDIGEEDPPAEVLLSAEEVPEDVLVDPRRRPQERPHRLRVLRRRGRRATPGGADPRHEGEEIKVGVTALSQIKFSADTPRDLSNRGRGVRVPTGEGWVERREPFALRPAAARARASTGFPSWASC